MTGTLSDTTKRVEENMGEFFHFSYFFFTFEGLEKICAG
jgi:hypothetical protein